MYQPKTTPSTSSYGSPKQSTRASQSTQRSTTPTLLVNNVTSGQVRGNQVHQVTPQVSPNVQQNLFAPPPQSNSFPPPPYFPIPFPPPPVPPSNVSIAPSAPAKKKDVCIIRISSRNNGRIKKTTRLVLYQTLHYFVPDYLHFGCIVLANVISTKTLF